MMANIMKTMIACTWLKNITISKIFLEDDRKGAKSHGNSPEMGCNWTDSQLCKISWSKHIKDVKKSGDESKEGEKKQVITETLANLLLRTPDSLQVFRIESSLLTVFCALGSLLSTYNSQRNT